LIGNEEKAKLQEAIRRCNELGASKEEIAESVFG
jgi:hypothetical protein